MSRTWIYKRIMDLFEKGDLIRIKATGEVFTFHSATGGANWSSYVDVLVGFKTVSLPTLRTHEIEKVASDGTVIDNFKQYRR